ncbi:DUF1360 domain-containing protein [Dietzia aurantiaca]|uniref:DUF1360 domain-containing protein n=1 Tax=Dietzia aurantiaca TaxID=983873 RepID=UPI001E351A7D|nr:DUF1360 domain-containing protein [Dietzia aurantiaca]MCD2263662.1 DUF1360 domain-containing protein [Dietzia aurantiaca]
MVELIVVFALVTLASARVTRVIVSDKIGEPLRARIVRWRGETSMLTYLVHCSWCTGLWVSAALVAAVWWPAAIADRIGVTTWLTLPLTILAVAHLVGLILTRGER